MAEFRGFSVRQGKKFEPDGNIFMQDAFNMGITIGHGDQAHDRWNRVVVMMSNHPTEEIQHFYIVNEVTGESITIELLKTEVSNGVEDAHSEKR